MNKDWLDIDVLEDYLDGKLDAKTMNRVEREALDDPFVAEALAGLSASPKRSLQSISLLQKQLHERVAEHKSFKKTSVITWQRLSIAAAAAVIFVSVSIMFWMKENNYQKQLAGRPKKVDVTIAPAQPKEVPPAVQADPVIANQSADALREKEIDKSAKTNSYAGRVKSKTAASTSSVAADDRLDEVVVVAFGTQPKQHLVGAVHMRAAKLVDATSQDSLSGKVIDKVSGDPLRGAIVQIEGTELKAITDAKGMFKIEADSLVKERMIRINYIGFKATELVAKINQPINISLTPELSSLNEVVIVGYGNVKKESLVGSVDNSALGGRVAGIQIRGTGKLGNKSRMVSNPIGGWDKLWKYIEENNTFKDGKKVGQIVELEFKITKDGTPEDIKIIKKADDKYEQEAIRLIINGPKWEPPAKANEKMVFSIDF